MGEENLIRTPDTLLPDDGDVREAIEAAAGDLGLLRAAVESNPASSLAWATLADAVYDPARALDSYAYARVAYHRGLDALRRAGWRGRGPIPWAHEPNRGVLRAVHALRRAARAIGEDDEVERLGTFLEEAAGDSTAELEAASAAWVPERPSSATPPTEAIVIRGLD